MYRCNLDISFPSSSDVDLKHQFLEKVIVETTCLVWDIFLDKMTTLLSRNWIPQKLVWGLFVKSWGSHFFELKQNYVMNVFVS